MPAPSLLNSGFYDDPSEGPSEDRQLTALEARIPTLLLEGLQRYAEHRIPAGGFLTAVLENNLKEAVQRADLQSQRSLTAIVMYCNNYLPRGSWGSPAAVRAWLASDIDAALAEESPDA